MVGISFKFSYAIFSFGVAVTHNICCFCQHMTLFFSNFGKANCSYPSIIWSVGASISFFPCFFFWTVAAWFDSLLFCFHLSRLEYGHFAIFGVLPLNEWNTGDILSELNQCKVSLIVSHRFLLPGGCLFFWQLCRQVFFSLILYSDFISLSLKQTWWLQCGSHLDICMTSQRFDHRRCVCKSLAE